MSVVRRGIIGGVALIVASLVALPAHADPTSECVAASDAGQLERDSGKLLAAREHLVVCAREFCPAIVRKDCSGWLADVEQRIPIVVLGAKDESGNDLSDVSVSMDGRPLLSRLGASAVPIDPGEHVFRFESKTAAPVETRIIAREGERQRSVLVVLKRRVQAQPIESPSPSPSPSPRRSIPVASWVLGGVALVGLGGFGYFFTSGLSDRDELERTCSPRCEDRVVDPAKEKILIADISLGVGIAAAVAAVVLYALDGPSSARPATATRQAPQR